MSNELNAVNEAGNTGIQANNTVSLNAGIKLSIFGITLMGVFEKNNTNIRVIVCPDWENPSQSVNLGTICSNAKVSDEVIKQVNEVLQELCGTDVNSITIDVNQAFYYYSNYDSDISSGINNEYAFSLGMTNHFEPPKLDYPFTIESVSFSLWNSTRQKVLEKMGMTTVSQVLEKFT